VSTQTIILPLLVAFKQQSFKRYRNSNVYVQCLCMEEQIFCIHSEDNYVIQNVKVNLSLERYTCIF